MMIRLGGLQLGNRRTLIGFLIASVILIAYPIVIETTGAGDFWITLMLQIFIWTTLATTWNFFSGYSGYSSFGHGAFYGVGMYTTSTMMVQMNVPFLLTLPFAGLMAALVSLIIGAIVFRLRQFRGELFSLLTLAMTFVIATLFNNITYIDGGSGVFLRGADTDGFATESTIGLYFVAFLIMMISVYMAYYIYQSRWGQALFAIRDDEDVADGLGVPTYRYKLLTFAVSSFFVGMIGSTQAIFLGYLEIVNVFSVITPLLALMMAILGGSGVWYGPIIGAVIITLLRQTLTSGDTAVLNQIIIGLVLIFSILFIPEGIAGYIERIKARLSRRTPTAPEEA